MKRKCNLIRKSKDGRREIYIDSDNMSAILTYIKQDDTHKKKFLQIVDLILGGYRNTELYDKENINKKCKDVYAMKFFKGGSNDRIYCKEFSSDSGVRVVICVELFEKKKSQGVNKKLEPIIDKISTYEYEFE